MRPTLLLDAGTGLRRLPGLLGDLPFRGTILLTHLHWDHVQGLPFFRSGDRDDARVTLLLPDQGDDTDAEALLARMMSPPFFPIGPSALRGRWQFGLVPGEGFAAEGFSVVAIDVPHKGGHTVGFRVSDGHSSVAYIPDHCPTALGPGPGGIGEYHDVRPRAGTRCRSPDSRRSASGRGGGCRGVVRPCGRRVRGAAGHSGRGPSGRALPPSTGTERCRGRTNGVPVRGEPRVRDRRRRDADRETVIHR